MSIHAMSTSTQASQASQASSDEAPPSPASPSGLEASEAAWPSVFCFEWSPYALQWQINLVGLRMIFQG